MKKIKGLKITSIVALSISLILFAVYLILKLNHQDIEEILFVAIATTIIGLISLFMLSNKLGRKVANYLLAIAMIVVNVVVFTVTIIFIQDDITHGVLGDHNIFIIILFLLVFLACLPVVITSCSSIIINIIKKDFFNVQTIILTLTVLMYITQFIYYLITTSTH